MTNLKSFSPRAEEMSWSSTGVSPGGESGGLLSGSCVQWYTFLPLSLNPPVGLSLCVTQSQQETDDTLKRKL